MNLCFLICKMELIIVFTAEDQYKEAVFSTIKHLEKCSDQSQHSIIVYCYCYYLLSSLIGTANVMSTCWVPSHTLDFTMGSLAPPKLPKKERAQKRPVKGFFLQGFFSQDISACPDPALAMLFVLTFPFPQYFVL